MPVLFPHATFKVVRRIDFWWGLVGLPAFAACLRFPAFMVVLYLHCACSGGPCSHLSRFRHVCFSHVWHGRHVFCATQLTCLPCHTADAADMSSVSHCRHVCCVTQQTCLLGHTAGVSAAPRGRHLCRVTQPTHLLCHTADMSAVLRSRHACAVTQ